MHDDPFLRRIDNFRDESIVPLNESFGFERFGKLVNETRKTMEFFGWLGHLFTNGTVGHCNNTISEGKCTVIIGGHGSEWLKKDILVLLMEMYNFHRPHVKNFERAFSYKRYTDGFARRAMSESGALGTMFTTAKTFYQRWALFWGEHLVNSTHGVDVYPLSLADVSDYCYLAWKTRNIKDAKMNAIEALTYLMGPDCEQAREDTDEYFERAFEKYRDEYYNISDYAGFNGGKTNRCFQKFMIRYLDYNKRKYEIFVDYLAQYIFQSISFYGYCLPIVSSEHEERESWIKWAVDGLEVLQTQLVDALGVFNETPSDQPFMARVDSFRRTELALIDESFGFERLQKVVDRTIYVTEFFGWLGSLFTTGIVGHFDKWSYREEIFVGADGSESLQRYVLDLIGDMYRFDGPVPTSDDPLVRFVFGTADGRELGLAALLYLFRPGCEAEKDEEWDTAFEGFQRECNERANQSGFTGGDSNRCLQKFMVRFTDYNRTAYETFVDYLGKFLFQEVSLYGYCLSIARVDWEEHESGIQWIADSIYFIRQDLTDALELFNEPPPTQRTSVSTTASTPSSPSMMPNKSTTSAPYPGQATDATAASTSGSITLAILEHAVNSVLPTAGIEGPMAWEPRAEKHQNIAEKIYDELDALNEAHYDVSFQVLVSLPQQKEQSDMQCMESNSSRHIKSFKSYGVSYFIQYFNKADLTVGLNHTWGQIHDNKAHIVDAVFSAKDHDLCKAAKKGIEKAVNKKVFGVNDGFSGLTALRCGRRFVWYQLAYRYFAVGRTAGTRFTLASAHHDPYNSNCGQIFLFP